MPRITTTVECSVRDTFRRQQVAGRFDLPLSEKSRETFSAELPPLDEEWTIGVIVGPSGSGKSTLARAAYGEAYYRQASWADDEAIVDGLGDRPIQEIARMLTAVGLGSPPTWIKPYRVLSGGEKFRCDLARALLLGKELVVFDEYTSVVDRTVAKIASAAVSRTLRQLRELRFVAVTCHYDVLEWLEPDWTLDLATGKLTRGCLRRPNITLQVRRCAQRLWRLFARHHYLTGELSRGATCFVALWNDRPVAFCAVVAQLGQRRFKRITRIVTLPDFQGLGIGMRLVETVCEHYRASGFRIGITATHPAVIAACRRSPKWRLTRVRKTGHPTRQRVGDRPVRTSAGRAVVSFEYIGLAAGGECHA